MPIDPHLSPIAPGPIEASQREPVYAPAEIKPPVPEANSYGGGIDAADLPPTLADDAAGPGTAHDPEGWRAIDTTP